MQTLTYDLYEKVAALGLRLDDISADNVMVRTNPLQVCAIDFDPNMTFEDDDLKAARGTMSRHAAGVHYRPRPASATDVTSPPLDSFCGSVWCSDS